MILLNRRHFLFTALITLMGPVASAQFMIHQGQDPQALVSSVLLGEGVEVSDVKFNGVGEAPANIQMASFSGGASVFGLESGIILATGGASVALGPNDFPSAHVPLPAGTSLGEEPDLEFIASPASVHDVAVLSFQFVAKGDVLRFRYVFASEEYNEYTCSAYNDVFGFFISGPGIPQGGPFENGAKNLALIPGTNVPVAINSINRGTAGEFGSPLVCQQINPQWEQHSQYFVNNENLSTPFNTQFDGFTVPFEVEVPVVCGETYQIKLAIADVVDDKNDSAVLIEANSFSSLPPLEAEAEVLRPDDEGRLMEGCSSLKLKISRSEALAAETVKLRTRYLDNAETILPDMPSSLTFLPNQEEIELEVDVHHDEITQGNRNFQLEILQMGVCSVDTSVTSIDLGIVDAPNMQVDYPPSVVVDCNDPSSIELTVTGGYPPYAVEWSNEAATGFSFEIHTEEEMTLSAEITDRCGVYNENVHIHLIPESYPPFQVAVLDSIQFGCVNPIQIEAFVSGGGGDHTFIWKQEGAVVSVSNPYTGIPAGSEPLHLTVTDRCEPSFDKFIDLQPIDNPLSVNIGEDTTGYCNQLLNVLPDVSGGEGTLSYLWISGGQVLSQTSVLSFYPKYPQTVVLNVSDACGRTQSDSMRVWVDTSPLSAAISGPRNFCPGDEVSPVVEIGGGTPPVSVVWKKDGQPVNPPFTIREDANLQVIVTDQCDFSAHADANLNVHPVHAEFEIDYERRNYPLLNLSTATPNMLWTFADGSTSPDFQPRIDDRAAIVGPILLEVSNDFGCFDATSLIFDPPMTLYFPNAFTPDGDGLNDVFKVVGEDIATFHLMIFDRWGNMVFETRDPGEGWRGNVPTQEDRYAHGQEYTYKYRAQSHSGEWKEGMGSVTMIR